MKVKPVTQRSESRRFLKTCTQLLGFLEGQKQLIKQGLAKNASLETKPGGELQTQRRLPGGILLQATTNGVKTALLRISLDPLRFEQWARDIGPVGLYYADPYGIEVVFQYGRWGLFIDEQELKRPRPEEGIKEIALFEVREITDGQVSVLWSPTEVHHEASPPSGSSQPNPSVPTPLGSRVLPRDGAAASGRSGAGAPSPFHEGAG